MMRLTKGLTRSRQWLVYPVLSLMVIASLVLGQPLVAKAISWGDLILRGIQVVQLSNLSEKQEIELGRQINAQIVNQVRIVNNPALTAYVTDIGERLAKEGDRPKIPYTFQVVQDRSINAFATMGGFVYVHTGLLQAANNEAELAGVIGHEIGHITGKHAINQMKEAAIAQGVVGAAGLKRNAAINIGVDLALRRPNSRRDEFDADQRGLKMLGEAGYAQGAMATFMERALNSKNTTPNILRTHPPTSDRVQRLRESMNPAMVRGYGTDNSAYKSKIRSLALVQ